MIAVTAVKKACFLTPRAFGLQAELFKFFALLQGHSERMSNLLAGVNDRPPGRIRIPLSFGFLAVRCQTFIVFPKIRCEP